LSLRKAGKLSVPQLFFNESGVKIQFLFQKDTQTWCCNTFWLYFHGSWSDLSSYFSDLLLAETASAAAPRAALRLQRRCILSDPWNERCCSTK